jgi:hypothetical protein
VLAVAPRRGIQKKEGCCAWQTENLVISQWAMNAVLGYEPIFDNTINEQQLKIYDNSYKPT